MSNKEKKPRCRECGCYDYVHSPTYTTGFGASIDHPFKRASRLSLWFRDHDTIWAHIKAWAWMNLRTGRSRMAYIDRLYKRRPDLCWCNLIDSWWAAEPLMRSDYKKPNGCVCDFPMPAVARVRPSDTTCYCAPIWGESEVPA